jgi:hypothetical protein
MYNLTVDDAHTFFVGEQSWLVHNTCPLFKADGSPNLEAQPDGILKQLDAYLKGKLGGNSCVRCAEGVAHILNQLGYTTHVEIISYHNPLNVPLFMNVRGRDGGWLLVSDQNYHEVIVITAPNGIKYYLDQVTRLQHRTAGAVPYEVYRSYFEYPDELTTRLK